MKHVWFFPIIALLLFSCTSIKKSESRDSEKAFRQEQAIADLKESLENRSFLFTATHAIPVSGGSISLNSTYDVTLKGDTINSYLPYFGVAYHTDYGSRNSALDFKQPVESFELEKTQKGYLLKITAKNGMDQLRYTFQIAGGNNAALNVNSINRQPITFYGHIEPLPHSIQPPAPGSRIIR